MKAKEAIFMTSHDYKKQVFYIALINLLLDCNVE